MPRFTRNAFVLLSRAAEIVQTCDRLLERLSAEHDRKGIRVLLLVQGAQTQRQLSLRHAKHLVCDRELFSHEVACSLDPRCLRLQSVEPRLCLAQLRIERVQVEENSVRASRERRVRRAERTGPLEGGVGTARRYDGT